MALAFRALSDQDVQQLAKLHAGKESAYFCAAVRTLRSDGKRPLKQALADFFDACWNAGLEQQVKAALDAARRDEKSPADVL